MNIEDFRDFCLSIKGATESFPFDDTTLVFNVMNKMFAYIGLTTGTLRRSTARISYQ